MTFSGLLVTATFIIINAMLVTGNDYMFDICLDSTPRTADLICMK